MAINGRPVSEDILAPGWTAYRDRLLVEAYDVTDLLRIGRNVITGVVGDGWYRGRLGWDPDGGRARYGTDVALFAQLEVDLDDGESTHGHNGQRVASVDRRDPGRGLLRRGGDRSP